MTTAAAVVALAAACTGPTDEDASPEPTSDAPTAEESDDAEPPIESPDEDDEEEVTEAEEWTVPPSEGPPAQPGDEGPAEAAPGDETTAAKAAKKTMTAFLDTSSEKKWWKTVAKHLTPAAKDVWKYTDPGRVPDAEITGSVDVTAISATDAEVTVPTSIGDYQLVLVREDGDAKWRTSAILPPEEDETP